MVEREGDKAKLVYELPLQGIPPIRARGLSQTKEWIVLR